MITVKTSASRKLYQRVTEVMNKINANLLEEAEKIASDENEKLNYETLTYTTKEVEGGGCKCEDRIEVILSVEYESE